MLYLKLTLCVSVLTLCFILAGRAARRDSDSAQCIRALAQSLLLFKNGMLMQRKTVREMLEQMDASDAKTRAFRDRCLALLEKDAEMPLEKILKSGAAVLPICEKYTGEVRVELGYIGEAMEQTMPQLGAAQLDMACGRLIMLADSAMQRYRKNLGFYRRMSLLCGAAVCLLVL